MANLINTLRDKYPMYSDRSDGELLEAYRLKYHKDKTLDQLEEAFDFKRSQEAREETDKLGFFGSLGRGFSRGVTQTGGLITDALPAIAADIVGADEYRDQQMQEYNERMKEMDIERPSVVPTYQDIEGIGSGFKYAAETVGQFIPSLVTSIGGGGLGGFIGQTAAKQAAKKMAADAAKDFAKKAVARGQIGGAFAGSGVQTIPEAYASLKEETGDYQLGTSLLVGGVNAALDSILPAAFLSRLGSEGRQEVSQNILAKLFTGSTANNMFKRAGQQAVKGGIIEGLTEGTQQATQEAAASILSENKNFFESETFHTILDATIRGAIGGKAFGSVEGAFFNKSSDARIAEERADRDSKLDQALTTIQGEPQGQLPAPKGSVPTPSFGLANRQLTEEEYNSLSDSEKTVRRREEATADNETLQQNVFQEQEKQKQNQKLLNETEDKIKLIDPTKKGHGAIQKRLNAQKKNLTNSINASKRYEGLLQEELDARQAVPTQLSPDEAAAEAKREQAKQKLDDAVKPQESEGFIEGTDKRGFKVVSSKTKEDDDGNTIYTPIKDEKSGEEITFETERDAADFIRAKGANADRYLLLEAETNAEIPVSQAVDFSKLTSSQNRPPREREAKNARQRDINVQDALDAQQATEGISLGKLAKQATLPNSGKMIPQERTAEVFKMGSRKEPEYIDDFGKQRTRETFKMGSRKDPEYIEEQYSQRSDGIAEEEQTDATIPDDVKVGDTLELYNARGEKVQGTVEDISKIGTLRVNMGENTVVVNRTGESVNPQASTENVKNPNYKIKSKVLNTGKRISELTLEELDALEENIKARVDGLTGKDLNRDQIRLDAVYDRNAIKARRESGLPINTASEKMQQEADVLVAAKKYVRDEISKIAEKGAQGKKLAAELEDIVFRRLQSTTEEGVTVGMALTAFRSADIINTILPQSANVTLNFLNSMQTPNGQFVEGSYNPAASLMKLSFSSVTTDKDGNAQLVVDDSIVRETAAHEGFHVLQQFFELHDPKVAQLLDEEFGGKNEIRDYNTSKASKWIAKYNKVLHKQLEAVNNRILTESEIEQNNSLDKPKVFPVNSDGKPIAGLEGQELAAYAFSAYNQARLNGSTPVLTGGLARFFNFARLFLLRMGNALRGMGFRSVDDVLEGISTGAAAVKLNGQPLASSEHTVSSVNENTPEEIVEEVDTTQYSRRTFKHPTRDEAYIPPADSFEFLKFPDGSNNIGYTRDKQGRTAPIKIMRGQHYRKETNRINPITKQPEFQQAGFGLRHVIFMHENDIMLNSPYNRNSEAKSTDERIVNFIQNVIANGKVIHRRNSRNPDQNEVKIVYGKDTYNKYGQSEAQNEMMQDLGWKYMGVVVAHEKVPSDPKYGGQKFYSIQTAFTEYSDKAMNREQQAFDNAMKDKVSDRGIERQAGIDNSVTNKLDKIKKKFPRKMTSSQKQREIGFIKNRTDLKPEEKSELIKFIKFIPNSDIRYSSRGIAMPKNIRGTYREEDLYSARTSPPNPEVKSLADEYKRIAGINKTSYDNIVETLTPELENLIMTVADIQENVAHSPNDARVKATYKAFIDETVEQYKMLGDVQIIPYEGKGEPYENSAQMMADMRENNRLYFFMTENGFGDSDDITFQHPLLEESEFVNSLGQKMLYNDLFRVTHDIFGHVPQGFSFGPLGEYNAFQEHSRMYSDDAIPALASETLAQNAWFNYGKHLRRTDGSLPARGDKDFVPMTERPYTDQKAHAFPMEVLKTDPENGTLFSARGDANPFPKQPNEEVEGRIRRQEKRIAGIDRTTSNAPRNNRTEFRVNGKLQFVTGKITFADWLEKTQNILNEKEFREARNWYKDANRVYRKYFGDDWPMHLAGWLMANQQASPSTAQMNSLRGLEKVLGKPIEGTGPKAGLPAEKLNTFFKFATEQNKNIKISAGAQKLYDFVDAGLLRDTRRWMGDRPEGGAPFVADVHTMRDMGMLDEVTLSVLEKKFGKAKIKNLKKDFGGSPTESQYELTADFGRLLTDYLNDNNVDGGGWTPAQVQAVGWMATTKFLEGGGQTPEFAILNNIRQLNFELAFGTGAPYNEKFPVFNELSTIGQKFATQEILDKILDYATPFTGATEKMRVHAQGGWDSAGANPNAKLELIATPEVVEDISSLIGLLAEQDAVLSSKFLKQENVPANARVGFFLSSPDGDTLGNNTMMDLVWQSLWNKRILENPKKPEKAEGKDENGPILMGYSTEVIDNKTGMAILPSGKKGFFGGKTIQKRIDEGDIHKAIQEVADELGIDISVEKIYYDANLQFNNWKEDKNGESYKQRIRTRYGDRRLEQVEDFKRGELESFIRETLEKAKRLGHNRPPSPIQTLEQYKEQLETKSSEEIVQDILSDEEMYSSRSGMGKIPAQQVLQNYSPNREVVGYKIFEQSPDGQLYPLFVDADNPVPVGVYLGANDNIFNFVGTNGKQYVPSKTGDYKLIADAKQEQLIKAQGITINYTGKSSFDKSTGKQHPFGAVQAVAYRPGWHAGDRPIAAHLTKEKPTKAGFKRVWAKVVFPDDTNWSQIVLDEAPKYKSGKEKGKPNLKEADLQRMPFNGFYKYKTNQSNEDAWMISGQMKVIETLDEQRVAEELNLVRNREKGLPDPRGTMYSSRGAVQSFEEVFLADDDSTFNRWLNAFRRIFPTKDKFVGEYVNGMEMWGKLEENENFRLGKGRKRMNVAEGAMKYLEMTMNTAGRNQVILKEGIPVMREDGEISIKEGSKGLMEIFKPLTSGTYKNFKKYITARRAQALGQKEKLINQATIDEWLKLETPEFKQMFEEYQEFNQGLLQFLVDSGVLTNQEKNNLAKYDYIPFYREMEEERFKGDQGRLFRQDVLGPNASNVLNNPGQNIIQKYKGNTQLLGDPLENIFRNAQAFISAGSKNKAMQKAYDLLSRNEIGKQVTKKESDFTVSFRINGQKVYYDLSEDTQYFHSLATMTPRQTKGLMKAVEVIARIFREGVTHAPPFMIANLIRGDMAGFVTVDAPLRPMIDTLGGLKNALNDTETIKEMKLIAGVGGYAWGDDYRDTAALVKRQMRARHRGYKIIDSPQAVVDLTKGAWGQLTKLGEASELATREAIYRRLREQGYSKMDAAYEALNVINFNRRGMSQTASGVFINSLLPVVPFLNARFQGLYRTFEPMIAGKEADRAATLRKGMGLMAANILLYSLMSQDERWREEPLHRKLAYHIVYPNMLGLEDVLGKEPILIPRAFEIGAIFTSIPEMFIDSVREKDGDIVADGLIHTFVNTFSFNPLPQALIPAIEVVANYDFFRGRNIDSASQLRYLPSTRVGPTTPEAARLLSVASGETLSPNQITQLINGYLGTLGGYMLTAFDVAASGMGIIPTRPTGVFGDSYLGQTAEALGFGRFRKQVPDASNKFVNDFYELKSDVDKIYSTFNRLAKDGRTEAALDLLAENKKKIASRGALNNLNKNLQNINSQIRIIRQSTEMSANDKEKRLKALIKQRNAVARNVEKIIKYIKS